MTRSSHTREMGASLHLAIAYGIVVVAFSLLGLRVWYLQGIKGDDFRNLSENNRTRRIHLLAPRGRILDREGKPIVVNRPSFNISLLVEDVDDREGLLSRLSPLVGVSVDDLRARLAAEEKERMPFEPKILVSDADREIVAKVKARSYMLPGVIAEFSPARFYPEGKLAASLLGYVREISRDQLQESAGTYYRGDMYGQTGLESYLEDKIRGESGFEVIEVDARGARRGVRGRLEPKSGNDVKLSLDLDLQKIAEQALGENSGAVVAMDPKSGEVLVLASAPNLDANEFSGKISSEFWASVKRDKKKPLLNRAISSPYPAGSTFKLFMALAGLEEGVITPNTQINCPGFYSFAGRRYRCHKKEGHGAVSLAQAIPLSCNVFFFTVGHALEVDRIDRYSTAFGFGGVTGINLPREARGVKPSRSWKLSKVGERWYPGDTLSVSIGQGYVTITPLQMAVALSGLVNGGDILTPRIVDRVLDPEVQWESVREVRRKLTFKPENVSAMREYAAQVVEGSRGTGKRAAIPGIRVGGKTGTAQVTSLSTTGAAGKVPDHAWFISFAPVEDPQIVMAVIVENGGHGGVTAAPISKLVMEAFFRKKGQLPPLETVEIIAPESGDELTDQDGDIDVMEND